MNHNRFLLRSLAITVMGFLLTACMASTARDARVANSFAWFDIVTDQGESARGFYSALFGWRFGPETGDGYRVISSGGELIGGLSHVGGTAPDVPESQWVAVLSVEDVAASSKVVKSSGGKVISGPLQTSEGNFALVRDNSRAALSLYDGKQGFPLGEPAKANTWVWVDLFAGSTSSAKSFYRSVAGFDTKTTRDGDGTSFTVFISGGEPRGGLVRTKRSEIEPNWLPYVLVTDLDTTLATAATLGGSVLAREGDSAIIVDPTGAAIGVTERKGGPQ